MRLSDLDYPLPKEKIALFPSEDRTAAKLLCVDRESGACSHRIFCDLLELLRPGDLLVLNDAKVLPARLFGKRATGGKVEILLLKDLGNNRWEALLKPGGRIKDGEKIIFSNEIAAVPALQVPRNDVIARRQDVDEAILEKSHDKILIGVAMSSAEANSGKRRIQFKGEDVLNKIQELGHIPLPPYIDRSDQPADRDAYQTVFAKAEGAVAAPTAGLHFDQPLLEKLAEMGVEIAQVTLHVSYGTFQPITGEHVEEHQMFEEEFEISVEAARKINGAKRAERRIIVCGTTCVRALESSVNADREVVAQNGKTSLFIYPPYEFKIADGLITNFHMPKSTLLAMVAAFLGYEKLMAAYNTALKENYRFASYGDAMFII